jgi:hypothetical protein
VWKGKYDEEGRLKPVEKPGPYPFQIVEVVNEPRIGKEIKPGETLGLFDYWKGEQATTFEEGWRNKLSWGDNKMVMSSLLENFAGTYLARLLQGCDHLCSAQFAVRISAWVVNKIGARPHSDTRLKKMLEEPRT